MAELSLHLSGTDLSALIPELSWRAERHVGNPVDLCLDANDLACLHWLWEDPLVHLFEPGSGRRTHAEQAVAAIGAALGRAFVASPPMQGLFERVLSSGEETLVLVSSEYDRVLDLPWELARTPDGTDLSSLVGGIARRRVNVLRAQPREGTGPLRVLLVVSRPAAADDVEYQAIAAKLLGRLEGRAEVKLVRPGTFPAFEQMVDSGGWDLVHYDGHGRAGSLEFENAMVKAKRIGRILKRSGVPVFVLNACQSAMCVADPAGSEAEEGDSVARVLVDTGAAAVVAMGASVRVGAAVTFFDRFYQDLANGATLNQACHRARRAVDAGDPQGPLDWAIPVLYLREDTG
jgi:hypothetical protein